MTGSQAEVASEFKASRVNTGIEQLQNDIASMRMPAGECLANSAFLNWARLAHSLKSWLAQLVPPAESGR